MDTDFFVKDFGDFRDLEMHLGNGTKHLREYIVEINEACSVLRDMENRYRRVDPTLPKPLNKQAKKVASNLQQIRRSFESSVEGCKVLAAEIGKAMRFITLENKSSEEVIL